MRQHLGLVCSLASLAIILSGCFATCEKRSTPKATAPQAPTVERIASEMKPAIQSVRDESRAAVKTAPQVKPHTDRIDAAADTLASLQAQLASAHLAIATSEKDCDRLRGDLAKASDRIKDLESDQNSTLRWGLRILAMAAVVGTAAAVWGGSMKLAGFCVTVFGCAIAGSFLLAWAKPIAIGVLVCLVGVAVYMFVTRQKGLATVVKFAEEIKATTDQELIKTKGRVIVGANPIVERVRRKIGAAA